MAKIYATSQSQKKQSDNPFSLDQALKELYSHSLLDSFPALALDSILSLVSACDGSFFLWNEFQKEFVLQAARGSYRQRMSQTDLKLRESILGWVGMQGTSVLVKDVHSDVRMQTLKRPGHYKSYSFMSIPLVVHNQLLGVVNVTEREDLTPFSEEDFAKTQAFSTHIALALHQLRRIQRLENENLELQQLTHRMERNQKEQEPVLAIGKLSAQLAHELNNPLDAIRRYVNLALDQSMEDSLSKEYLTKAKKSIRRAISVIRHLLQFMAASKKNVRIVEVHKLIEQSLELKEDPRFEKIKIQKDFCNTPSYVADRGLVLVFQNLFHNACHAMKETGTITISTHREDESKLTLFIEDNGHGIPQELQPYLFEPLRSSKNPQEGIGIGLSLCREIIESCGGTIIWDSSAQRGTRFVITLPCLKKGESHP